MQGQHQGWMFVIGQGHLYKFEGQNCIHWLLFVYQTHLSFVILLCDTRRIQACCRKECFHWTQTCLNFSFLSTCYRYMYFRSKYGFSNTIYINRMFDYSGTFHWSICPRICPFFPAIKTQDSSAGYRFIDRLGTYCCLDIISWQYPAKIHSVSTWSVSIPHGFSSSSVPPNKPTSQKNQTCVKCLPF